MSELRSTGRGDNRLVLVVEDNERNARLIRVVLEANGFRTAMAGDGAAALARLEEALPDLVLLDIQLPDASGVEILRQVRSDPRTQALPVVAVTAFAMKGDEANLLAAGFDAYIAKPIVVAEIVDELLMILGRAEA